MGTIQDELIAELLGDVGKLSDDIKALPDNLSIITGKMIQVAENLSESAGKNIKSQEKKSLAEMEQKQKTLHMEMKAAIREESSVMLDQLTAQLKNTLNNHEHRGRKTALFLILGGLIGIGIGIVIGATLLT